MKPTVETSVETALCTLGGERVPFHFGVDLVAESLDAFTQLGASSIFVVVDENAAEHFERYRRAWSAHFPLHAYPFKASEQTKSLKALSQMASWAIGHGVDRRSVCVAFGGGVTGNIAGLLAHLLLRHLPLVHFPTTYVAAFDSVLSQKQAVNDSLLKNCIGAYHVPTHIFCDSGVFDTLPARDVRAGIAESIKNACIVDPSQVDQLLALDTRVETYGHDEHALIWRLSAEAKLPLLASDPKEKGPGLIFEYGHTTGHAIEAASKDSLRHGEAVALGLRIAARLANEHFGLSSKVVDLHDRMIDHFGLPLSIPDTIDPDAICGYLRLDNKRGYIPCGTDEVGMVVLKDLALPYESNGLPLVPVEVPKIMDTLKLFYDYGR